MTTTTETAALPDRPTPGDPDVPEVTAAAQRLARRGIPIVTLVTDLPASGRLAYLGMDSAYVSDLREMAHRFEDWRYENDLGDPDAPRHRVDDPATVAEMAKSLGA